MFLPILHTVHMLLKEHREAYASEVMECICIVPNMAFAALPPAERDKIPSLALRTNFISKEPSSHTQALESIAVTFIFHLQSKKCMNTLACDGSSTPVQA